MGKVAVYGHQKNKDALIQSIQNRTLRLALLFSGPDSVGKKQTALYTAQALLCLEKESPCGRCLSCLTVEEKRHSALLLIEPKDLSIKLEAVHQVRSFLKLQSFSSCRVVIVDQAHAMNLQTQNAFLKILEEPPKNVYIILVCGQEGKLLSTIRSRAVRYRFNSLSLKDMKRILPDAEESLLKAGRGRLDRACRWNGKEELLKEIFNFWRGLLQKQRVSHSFSAYLKDRKTACLTAQVWQEILRDVRIYQEGVEDWTYPHQKELYQQLSKSPKGAVDLLYRKALYLEQDVLAYLNSLLCVENYWNQAYQAVHGV